MAQDKAGIKNRQSKMNNWQLHQKDIYDIYKDNLFTKYYHIIHKIDLTSCFKAPVFIPQNNYLSING